MRITALSTVLLAAAAALGCSEPASPTAALLSAEASLSRSGSARNFFAHLSGGEEVPANESRAQGQIKLQLSPDGESLSYKLIVSNLDNVHMAHLHMAPAGSNGGVVVWLYPSAPPPQLIAGRTQGVLAEGVITATSLRGALAGQPLSSLIDAFEAGLIYANVHTTPDFPGGEVRGQIRGGG